MKQTTPNFNSVEKALTILTAFREDRSVWGVRELSAHLGFSPATVQRLLTTLKKYAFVDQDIETRQYRLGNVYFSFLHTLQLSNPVNRVALPYMKRLASTTQETVHLNVIDGMERICIETIESAQFLKAGMPIGSRSPLYAGGSSKCLLAFSSTEFIENYLDQAEFITLTNDTVTDKKILQRDLEQIKLQGYAVSLGERNPGLGSLSAPVFNYNNVILAAVSLAIPEIRFMEESHRHDCLNQLTKTARAISKAMGTGTTT